jgi:phytoene synthase
MSTAADLPAEPEKSGEGAAVASGSSFYLAMRILPRAQREAMYAVYGFCRAVDDIADSTELSADLRCAALEDWRREVDGMFASGAAGRIPGLAAAIHQHDLARDDFEAVIDGMMMDAAPTGRPFDWAMLDLYCDRVASAVGRLSVKIFGLDPMRGIPLAHHLGRALQLTNILRDIDEDAALGRLYLPEEPLAGTGMTDLSPAAVLAHPGLDDACRAVAARARQHFAESERVMAAAPRRAVRAPRLMASAYSAVLDATERRGWHPPRTRVSVSKGRLVLAVLRYGLR